MSDHDRICAKLDKLQTYYTELKSLSSISLDEYISNSIYRRAQSGKSLSNVPLTFRFPC